MARSPQLDWERLLDGKLHRLNLDTIGWQRGLNDLRAKVHYEADKRRGVAHTHKIDAVTLEFYAVGCRVNPLGSGPCTCGAGAAGPHVITCAILHTWPTPLLSSDHPDYVPGPGVGPSYQPPSPAPKVNLAPQDQPPTPTSQATEPDDEALLGPCTCGLAPNCSADCARFLDAVA